MPILVNIDGLTQSFSARPLFRNLTFSVESGERIGLIGPNGAGKSTLLRILSRGVEPDSGRVTFQKGLRVGFLEQSPAFSNRATVVDSILEGVNDGASWEARARAEEIASKFDLLKVGLETPVATLSGGWKKRIALAREWIKSPDLLLLDEPTNHLDIESILWLETLLAQSRMTTLTITHDRAFLQNVSTRIIEINPRHADGLLSVRGSYAEFLDVREQLLDAQEQREIILRNTFRRETEWLRQGAKARTTKQQARIQRAGELQQEVESLEIRNRKKTVEIDFASAEKNPKKLIDAQKLNKTYGDRKIVDGVDLLLTPSIRLGLLGPNGSGKSTLIRLLLKEEKPDSGEVRHADRLSIAYFDQTRNALDPDQTLAQTLCPVGEYVNYRGARVHIRGYLDRFLFSSEQMDMKVGKLSGGEQSRLLIAQLMLRPANVLVLDEPTNDLDIATLNILQDCLSDFSGAVILVSHDRFFLDQVSNRLLAADVRPTGRWIPFASLAQWEEWRTRETERIEPQRSKPSSAPSPAAPSSPAVDSLKKARLSYKEKFELENMEANIHAVEEKFAQLERESMLPENTARPSRLTEIAREMSAAQAEIQRLYDRWSELEQKDSK